MSDEESRLFLTPINGPNESWNLALNTTSNILYRPIIDQHIIDQHTHCSPHGVRGEQWVGHAHPHTHVCPNKGKKMMRITCEIFLFSYLFVLYPLQDKCHITSNTITRLLSTQWWGINNEIRINSFHGIKVELNWPLGQQTDHPKPDQTRHLAQTRHCRSVEPHFIPRADYRRQSFKNNRFLPITRGLVMETLRQRASRLWGVWQLVGR